GLHRRQARRTCSDHGHVSSHTLQYGNRTVGYGQVDLQARTRLSRQAWVDAALEALGEGGLASVAVVPLAERLGATKGSFYWHFRNRPPPPPAPPPPLHQPPPPHPTPH